jgi:hypothetical protein
VPVAGETVQIKWLARLYGIIYTLYPVIRHNNIRMDRRLVDVKGFKQACLFSRCFVLLLHL